MACWETIEGACLAVDPRVKPWDDGGEVVP